MNVLRALVLLLLTGSVSLVSPRPCAADPPPFPDQVLTTRFSYTATVPAVPAATHALDVWLPVPSDSVWQTVSSVAVQAPVPFALTTEPKLGNRMVALHEDNPARPMTVRVTFTVAWRAVQMLGPDGALETKTAVQMPPAATALAGDRRVAVGGRFRTIAFQQTQAQPTTLAKERALFDDVVAGMHYDYQKSSPEYGQGDAAFVCDYKRGNCSDLHSYLIALSRSIGTPAVLEFGFPLTGVPTPSPLPTDGKVTGYHCWTWFQDNRRGWLPLAAADARRWQDAKRPDVSRFLFGNLVLARSAVTISLGRDLTLVPPQKSGPLNYFVYPYAEADGKPVRADWQVAYHVVGLTP